VLDLKGSTQHGLPLGSLAARQDSDQLGIQFGSVPFHIGPHLFKVRSLSFTWGLEVRSIRLHDVAHLLPLIFRDSKLFSQIRPHERHCTLLLKANLLVPFVLRIIQDRLDLVLHFLVLGTTGTAKTGPARTTGSATVAPNTLSATLRGSPLSAATRITAEALATAAWRSSLALCATCATRTAKSTWPARSTTFAARSARTASRHKFSELSFLVFGQLQLFLDARVHQELGTLEAHPAKLPHSGTAAHSGTLLTVSNSAASRTCALPERKGEYCAEGGYSKHLFHFCSCCRRFRAGLRTVLIFFYEEVV